MVMLDLERATAICSDPVVAMDSDGGVVKEAAIDSDQVTAAWYSSKIILVHVCKNLASRNFEGIIPFPGFVGLKSPTFRREPALDGSGVEASKERIVEEQD